MLNDKLLLSEPICNLNTKADDDTGSDKRISGNFFVSAFIKGKTWLET